ncbi:hypothetical protein DRQ12_12540, partial [candidate division KSB1 bacterium]
MRNMKLGTKLIVGGLTIVLVPLLIVGMFSIIKASEALDDLEREQLVNLRQSMINLVELVLNRQKNLLSNASNDSLMQQIAGGIETGVLEMVQFHLDTKRTIFHDKKVYEIFFVTDTNGNIIGDTSGGIYRNTNISKEEYFKKAIKGNTVIGKVVKPEKNGHPYVIIASPLRSQNKKIIGVIAAGWKIEYLNKKINELKLGKTGHAFILDKKGMIIIHPDKEVAMKVNINQLKGM